MIDALTSLIKIIQHDDTQRLISLLNRFNPYEVLRIGESEIRHTNTLAWLLDPTESHGLGDGFLRGFISRLDAQEITTAFEVSTDRTVTVQREVQLRNLRNNISEWERLGLNDSNPSDTNNNDRRMIDIVIEGQAWLIAIEAKINARQSSDQLKDYSAALNQYTENTVTKKCYLFLTKNYEKPDDSQWNGKTWIDAVIEPLSNLLSLRNDKQSEVFLFMTSYLETLSRYAGDRGEIALLAFKVAKNFPDDLYIINKEIKEKKQSKNESDGSLHKIQQRHSQLIKLLINEMESRTVGRAHLINEILGRDFESYETTSSYISFAPKNWREEFSRMMTENRLHRIFFEVVNRDGTIAIKLMVPSLGEGFDDAFSDRRRVLINKIHEKQECYKSTFPGAFKRNGDPRTYSDKYYSIRTDSRRYDSDDEMKRSLQNILENLIEQNGPIDTLCGLMKSCGFD